MFKTILTIIALCLLSTPALADKKSDDHYKWLNANKEKVYFLAKNTLFGHSRKSVVKAFQIIQQRGGTYNTNRVGRLKMRALKSWSVGRIIEVKKGSDIVKIRFKLPYSDQIIEGYFWGGQIELVTEYRKRMIR